MKVYRKVSKSFLSLKTITGKRIIININAIVFLSESNKGVNIYFQHDSFVTVTGNLYDYSVLLDADILEGLTDQEIEIK